MNGGKMRWQELCLKYDNMQPCREQKQPSSEAVFICKICPISLTIALLSNSLCPVCTHALKSLAFCHSNPHPCFFPLSLISENCWFTQTDKAHLCLVFPLALSKWTGDLVMYICILGIYFSPVFFLQFLSSFSSSYKWVRVCLHDRVDVPLQSNL